LQIPNGATGVSITMETGYGVVAVTGTCDYGALTIRNLASPGGSFANDGGSILTP